MAPSDASRSRRSFATGGAYTKVLRVAERHAGLRHGVEHGVAVPERGGEHRLARLRRLTEGARQRLLDDHVLAGARRRDRDLVVGVGRRADVDDVHVRRRNQLAVVGEHALHNVVLGERLGLGPRAGAHGCQLDLPAHEWPIVDGVERGGEARPDDPDAQRAHASFVRNQSPTRWRAERTSHGRR